MAHLSLQNLGSHDDRDDKDDRLLLGLRNKNVHKSNILFLQTLSLLSVSCLVYTMRRLSQMSFKISARLRFRTARGYTFGNSQGPNMAWQGPTALGLLRAGRAISRPRRKRATFL